MPVDSKHPDYVEHIDMWSKCRLALKGEDAVKEAGQLILPMIEGMSEREYQAYKNRAVFFSASSRTVKGLVGIVLSKPIQFEGIQADDETLKNFGDNGKTFEESAQIVLEEVIGIGSAGILTDSNEDENAEPYNTIYKAEDIINWRFSLIDGELVPSMIVLRETYEKDDDTDVFTIEEKVQYRVLRLYDLNEDVEDDETIALRYVVDIWRQQELEDNKGEVWNIVETLEPKSIGGTPMDRIPFVFVTAEASTNHIDKSPIVDLVNINLSHYRSYADLEHGRHFTALPTAWLAGFPVMSGDIPIEYRIGSSVAWITDDNGAKAGYLEFTGKGLDHLTEALKEKQALMAVLGARLLEDQKRDSEAYETVRLRHSGERSILVSITLSVEQALTESLKNLLLWKKQSESESVVVELNKDFNVATIDPQMMEKLMGALQSSAISWNTWFYNLKKGEIIPPGITDEEEQDLIEETLKLGLVTPPVPENPLEEELDADGNPIEKEDEGEDEGEGEDDGDGDGDNNDDKKKFKKKVTKKKVSKKKENDNG